MNYDLIFKVIILCVAFAPVAFLLFFLIKYPRDLRDAFLLRGDLISVKIVWLFIITSAFSIYNIILFIIN